jgi:tripartite-type tricarboxylate transporter receptor subunit TctC
VARVNAAANEAVSDPEVRDKLSKLGIEPATGTPAQFGAMVAQDAAKWKKIITERKIISD